MVEIMSTRADFILFYDGLCPICRREVAWLRRRNQNAKLGFVDINAAEFKAEVYGKTMSELVAEIHGVYEDGRLIKDVAVFEVVYQAVGLGWLAALLRCPVLKPVWNVLYRGFAKSRPGLGRLLGGKACHRSGGCSNW